MRPAWILRENGCLLILLFLTTSISVSFGSPDAPRDTYSLKLDLPSEVVYDLTVVDTLPQGLIYDPASLTISGAATTAEEKISGQSDGIGPVTLYWSLGQVDNSANEDVRIEFKAMVADVAGNRKGAMLGPGEVKLYWKDAEGKDHESVAKCKSIKIVEPDLDISRSFEPSSGWRDDVVSCTLSLRHAVDSTADAFDINVLESLPNGLSYVPGSLQMVNGPAGEMNESHSEMLGWHFPAIDRSWSGDQKILLMYRAIIGRHVLPGESLTCNATLDWSSAPDESPQARRYEKNSEGMPMLTPRSPDLRITLADNPDPVRPGGVLNYTIGCVNKGGCAIGTTIEANYDANLEFLSSTPAPDEGTDNRWTVGDFGKNESAVIRITARTSPSIKDGSFFSSSASISSDDGASAQATATTRVSTTAPMLSIEKTASAPVITPGSTLNYVISFSNLGDRNAGNVTVTDIVDPHLLFDPALCTPPPSENWTDSEGTHLKWNATTLDSQSFAPGDSGRIEFMVSMPSEPQHPQFDIVVNRYKIDSDESEGSFNSLETFVVHSLYIRKQADKETFTPGETINYTIVYGNELAVEAKNAVIYDVLPHEEGQGSENNDSAYVEFLEADPQPTSVSGNVLVWDRGTIDPKGSGTIHLYVKIKENLSLLNFMSSETVSGYGFVRLNQKFNTESAPKSLTNYVNITAYYLGLQRNDSGTSTVRLPGTAVTIEGHGSGSYRREDEALMLMKNKSIQVKTSLSEVYNPTSFSLPNGRTLSYNSRWFEAQQGKNRITGATINERYMYATSIDRESIISLDKNGSTLYSGTSFQGAGHIGVLKKPDTEERFKGTPTYESREDYLGNFTVSTNVDEYGKNLAGNRTVSGTGMASSDRRISNKQRSYESGTGTYRAEEITDTLSNYMAKNLSVVHGPVSYAYTPDVRLNLSHKWKEGMWTRSGSLSPKGMNSSVPVSFISEEYSDADFLNMSTVASGINEMNTEAEFSGRAEFKAAKESANGSGENVALYDEYIGKYRLSRKTLITGVARFDTPHLSISKAGKMEPPTNTAGGYAGGGTVSYTIAVENDGNRALGPVYVTDLFPPGTKYVSSSYRPTEIGGDHARWKLLSLGIGESVQIELKLKAKEGVEGLVNRVQADGAYTDQWVSAHNFSVIQINFQSCCPAQMLVTKRGNVDTNDAKLIHYNITLQNLREETIVATIDDQLPQGMEFIGSSASPSNVSSTSNTIRWNLIEIRPGENRTIDYRCRALWGGIFENLAHVEAFSLDGADLTSTDVISSVFVEGEGYRSWSTWQPPACFGLNCTQQGFENDWMACVSCNSQEPETESQVGQTCPACSEGSGYGEGYEIP
jgi:uncharacterized repeat protein (TIGR01451 family)